MFPVSRSRSLSAVPGLLGATGHLSEALEVRREPHAKGSPAIVKELARRL